MTTGNVQSNGSSNLEIAQSNQDLIITKGRRKKRTWIIAGVVCTIVVALVVAAIVLLTTSEESKLGAIAQPSLSLEDILDGKVNPSPFNGTWTSGNELLYTDHNGNLVLHNLFARSRSVLIPAGDSVLEAATVFELSADGRFLLVGHHFAKIYRHSFRGKYTIIELATSAKTNVTVNGFTGLLLVVWAPVGNALAFVVENNIYYKSSVDAPPVQITADSGFTINGIPDWVYEEEVFSSNKALWFSPDGRKLAFARFNDTDTPVMVLQIYGQPGDPQFQYPKPTFIKYPKVGTPNPTVSLHFVDLNNVNEIVDLAPSVTDAGKPILTTVSWATNDTIFAIWMKRVQNEAVLTTYSTTAPYTTTNVKSLTQAGGWLELFTAPLFSSDGSKLALILSSDQGTELGSYRHIILLSREESLEEPLTSGAFVVTELLGWNQDRNEIFYLANTDYDSAVQHLYSVSVDTKDVKCLSCNLSTGSECTYNSAEFNKDASYFALTCAGPGVPNISIHSLDEKITDWEDNLNLRELVTNAKVPTTQKFFFEIADGFRAQVSLKLPPNMDTSGNVKYPMLVNVYAGPDSFQVVDKFNLDWGSYLAANKSIIYATIDGRGSGLKGDNILFSSYRRLGTVEITDQINVTRQIQDTLKYVDPRRTAVWGWSYGGYASGMILAEDKEGIFKCGISVAPVTDWTLYDSIYTERFMGIPSLEDNAEGYRNASLLLKYEGLRDKEYFLIHGTYDDNVHYQQSMLWARVLEQHDILFRQLSYPDEDHGLGSVRRHLYHSLENFLDECFIADN